MTFLCYVKFKHTLCYQVQGFGAVTVIDFPEIICVYNLEEHFKTPILIFFALSSYFLELFQPLFII